MSALMTDVIEGSITPVVANAAVNAGGKLLKAVELQLKYGKPTGAEGSKILNLCGDTPADSIDVAAQARIAALENELQRERANLRR